MHRQALQLERLQVVLTIKAEFLVVEKNDVWYSGVKSWKIVLRCFEDEQHKSHYAGRLALQVSEEEFNQFSLGQRVQVTVQVQPSLRAVEG